MKLKKYVRIMAATLFLCLAISIGLFLYNAHHNYNINNDFTSLPLNYNPDDSSSNYSWNGVDITVHGGFVKGIDHCSIRDSLVIRALSPLPTAEIRTSNLPVRNLTITIENINPEYYAERLSSNFNPSRIAANSLQFSLNMDERTAVKIEPTLPTNTESDNYIILGDSRDGYETFDEIIAQVNAIKPAFVINNGDLVYSGKPNQYLLFDQAVSGLSSTLCTTLGNHDIRHNGRETYSKLYGPEYYSFDFGNNHFIFLDSSRGYAEKRAIPEEQYQLLERDLQKAQGKHIYVVNHIPPTDPRAGLKPNEIEAYTDKVKKEGGFIEKKLEDYEDDKSINHGFRDKQEATRFENLMKAYKVIAVYASHIHSYFDFYKDDVRYVISGGAGAELLTRNSYYHYLIAKAGPSNTLTMVQLPSPPNLLLQRYTSTVSLFSEAMYKENKEAVVFFIIAFILLVLSLLTLLVIRFNHRLSFFWLLIKDTCKYVARRYKELYNKE